MRLRTALATGASLVATAQAFQDTSPFLALLPHSIPLDKTLDRTFAASKDVDALVDRIAQACPSRSYVVVTQPGYSSADLRNANSHPHLQQRITTDEELMFVSTPEVVGQVDSEAIVSKLQTSCGLRLSKINGSEGRAPPQDKSKKVVQLSFAPLPIGAERESALLRNDATLNAVLKSVEGHGLVTLLYTTTPGPAHGRVSTAHLKSHVGHATPQQHPMQVDFDVEDGEKEPVHMAWKRDLDGHISAKARTAEGGRGSSTNAGLFETYNFLSPGIFMGAFALILLMTILLTGMNALAGVSVSYQSFNKEMVTAMQKAQKQQ